MTDAEFNDLVCKALTKCAIAQAAAANIFHAKEAAYYEAKIALKNAEDDSFEQYYIDHAAACAARDASTKE